MTGMRACMKKVIVLVFVAFYALSPFSVYYAHGGDCPCSEGFNQCGLAGYECPCCHMDEEVSMHHVSDGPVISSCSTPIQVYAASISPSVSEPLAAMDVYFEYAYEVALKDSPYQYYSVFSMEKPPPVSCLS